MQCLSSLVHAIAAGPMGLSNVFTRCFIVLIHVVHAVDCPIPHACLCMRSLVQAIAAAQAGISVFMSVAFTRVLSTLHSAISCQRDTT